jgi:DNA-binding NarL/FixJ family response regulator
MRVSNVHMMQGPVRVLLVDDNVALRSGMRMLLSTDALFDVVGEADDGESSVRLAAQLSPNVILMDVQMPGAFSGIEATRRIMTAAGESGRAPIVLALSAADEHRAAMQEAGASDFIPKHRTQDLLTSIKRAIAIREEPA